MKAAMRCGVALVVALAAFAAVVCAVGARPVHDMPGQLLDFDSAPRDITGAEGPVIEDDAPFPDVDWKRWLDANPAIVGWITVPGTSVDHPIVAASEDDPCWYLGHDVFGGEDPYGCPYLDSDCKEGLLAGRNSVVFGHNIGGQMFSELALYCDAGFAASHREVLLQTPSWRRRLHVMSVEVSPGNAPTKVVEFDGDASFECWLQGRYDASCVKMGGAPVGEACPKQVLTLCTCSSNASVDERVLVYAAEATGRVLR